MLAWFGRLYRRTVGRYTCAESGYAFPETERCAGQEEFCPQCGGTSVNAGVFAHEAAIGVESVGSPSILITTPLWLNWMGIAIDQARAAGQARDNALKDGPSNGLSNWMRQEFDASLIAIAASAHALDALYGSTVVPDSVRAMWVDKGTKRHGKIREALKLVFVTGPVNDTWVVKFEWLFDLRDAAAHAMESPKPPVAHPLGTNTAPEYVDYSMESAVAAVELALSVLRWCVDHPKPTMPEAVGWAAGNQSTVAELENRWA